MLVDTETKVLDVSKRLVDEELPMLKLLRVPVDVGVFVFKVDVISVDVCTLLELVALDSLVIMLTD